MTIDAYDNDRDQYEDEGYDEDEDSDGDDEDDDDDDDEDDDDDDEDDDDDQDDDDQDDDDQDDDDQDDDDQDDDDQDDDDQDDDEHGPVYEPEDDDEDLEEIRRSLRQELEALSQSQQRTIQYSEQSRESWVYRVAKSIARIISAPFRWIADAIRGFLDGLFH